MKDDNRSKFSLPPIKKPFFNKINSKIILEKSSRVISQAIYYQDKDYDFKTNLTLESIDYVKIKLKSLLKDYGIPKDYNKFVDKIDIDQVFKEVLKSYLIQHIKQEECNKLRAIIEDEEKNNLKSIIEQKELQQKSKTLPEIVKQNHRLNRAPSMF